MERKPPDPTLDVAWCRRQFPALRRTIGGQTAVFFDGPGGSQVPQRVIDMVGHYLGHLNANHGGLFATSRESDEILEAAHQALADIYGTDDPGTIVFGPNMTSLTLALSRAVGRCWQPGDEVLVSRLDHDANVSPWVLAARDAGATVRHVEIRREDCTLDMEDLARKLSPKTRLVAVGYASNAVGSINPIEQIVTMAHAVGALVYVDAVHFAPHGLIDVGRLGCDFLVASAYKFFGPHVGVLWGRRELLESLPAYKVRPAPNSLPGRWMTGTQNHEGIAGSLAAVEYLAELGRTLDRQAMGGTGASPVPRTSTGEMPVPPSRRAALSAAYAGIVPYEQHLAAMLLDGLAAMPDVKVWGITDPARKSQRVPTVAITHRRYRPRQIAESLAARGIFTWHGNFYALPLTEALELEPDGLLRIGLLHYNTEQEIERLLAALTSIE